MGRISGMDAIEEGDLIGRKFRRAGRDQIDHGDGGIRESEAQRIGRDRIRKLEDVDKLNIGIARGQLLHGRVVEDVQLAGKRDRGGPERLYFRCDAHLAA